MKILSQKGKDIGNTIRFVENILVFFTGFLNFSRPKRIIVDKIYDKLSIHMESI